MEQEAGKTTCCYGSQPYGLRLNEDFVDMEITVGSETYRVHRETMAAKSDYFRAVMSSQMEEAREKRVIIGDLDPDIMRLVIEFCYTNQVSLIDDNFHQVLSAAFRFCIESLKDVCIKFIESRITVSNCTRLIHSFQQYSLTQLLRKAIGFSLENFDLVCETPEFFDIEEDIWEILLPDERLNLTESGIFRALFKWTEHDSENRKAAFERLVKHVRFGTINARELSELGSLELATMSVWLCKEIVAKVKYYLETERQNKQSEDEPLAEVSATPRRNLRNCQRMYAIGGFGYSESGPYPNLRTFFSVEIYDPITDKWTEAAPMFSSRESFGCAVLGDHIYVAGGSSNRVSRLDTFERYSIADNTWESLPDMLEPRCNLALVALDEYLYAIGGYDGYHGFDMVERFCPSDTEWHECTPMLIPRPDAAYVALDGYIYAIGGDSESHTRTTLERYDPKTDSWCLLSPLSRGFEQLQFTCYKGMIHVMCRVYRSWPLLEFFVYNPFTDRWSNSTRLPTGRWPVAGCCLPNSTNWIEFVEFGRQLYAVGVLTKDSILSFVGSYNPETKQWTTRSSMMSGRVRYGLIVHPQRNFLDSNVLASLVMGHTQ